MIIAGITGGIGSGKTTVCKEWEKLGAVVVYADDLAKDLMVRDEKLREKLISLFGSDTYNKDGSLNKPHLVEQAFQKGRVQDLNNAVHPVVQNAFAEICSSEKAKGTQLVVKEAALMLNKGRPKEFDCIVLVLSRKDNRISRVQIRDNAGYDEIVSRMDQQPDYEELTHLSDHVINNDGTLHQLQKKSQEIYKKITTENW